VTDLLARFIDDLDLRGLSKGTQATYRAVLVPYFRHLGKDPCTATKEDFKAWLYFIRKERGQKTKTVELSFSILSSFYEYLLDEGLVVANPIPVFRKRNLRAYKSNDGGTRRSISIEEAGRLVSSIVDSRDRAIIMLLLKTGVRRHELAELDIEDVDMEDMSIQLKPTPKRSNRTVFFDGEAYDALVWWLQARKRLIRRDSALFVGSSGYRLKPDSINRMIKEHAIRVELHDPKSKRHEDHFTAHSCRHFLTTHLLRAGMKREYVQWLRGDAIRDAVDIYFHINPEDVREQYLAYVPKFG